MATSIRHLLDKKKLRGEDVGRAIIMSLAHDLSGSRPPLFKQSELEQMKGALATERDIDVYNGYVSLENTLLLFQSLSQGFFQQAQNGFYRLNSYIISTQRALELQETRDLLEGSKIDPNVWQAREKLSHLIAENDVLRPDFDTDKIILARDSLLLPALRQIYAYNTFFDIAAAKYAISEINAFKLNLELMEEQITVMNGIVVTLGMMAAEAHQKNPKNFVGKRTVAEIFPFLDFEAQRPSKKTVSTVADKLPEPAALRRPPFYLIEALTGKGASL